MNVKLVVIFFGFFGLLSACAPQATVPVDLPQTGIDGLQEVTSKYFDAAYVRPGVDFSRYSDLLVSGSELAFRTPDRKKKQFPLAEEQKERFRQLLDAQFANELVAAKNLRMTDSPGPEVLALHVRVQDIVAMISPRSVGNSAWGGIALQALGGQLRAPVDAEQGIALHDLHSDQSEKVPDAIKQSIARIR